MKLDTDIFSLFDQKWALLCSGTAADHNAMTVSWGGLGTLWGKPAATVYVRHSRHTYGYMNTHDLFTLSFFPEDCRRALEVMGSVSGRDTDKDAAAGLTPKPLEGCVAYEEAELVLVCRVMMSQDMDPDAIPEDALQFYPDKDWHRIYIGEVVDIIRK
ncbi:MAG: flavin reductase [Abditibacteriota bacterium]|nr:flavin reductase [Abditibacteriota bacterium]